MYINNLSIKNFRAYRPSFSVDFAEGVTIISGQNGIGKSTILALLSATSELKGYKSIDGRNFRGDLADLILFDEISDSAILTDEDNPGATISFSDTPDSPDYPDKLALRPILQNIKKRKHIFKKIRPSDIIESSESNPDWAAQMEKLSDKELYEKKDRVVSEKRFRFLPVKTKTKPNEKKIEWPVLYLGMIRSYPTGEANSAKTTILPDDDQAKLTSAFKQIMGMTDDNEISMASVSLNDQSIKNAGINSPSYGPLSNSVGQSTLSQIIMAVQSFERLSNEYPGYIGGLLVIDEIDVTLHAAAQNRLLDYLVKKSKQLNLQIIATSHSITLLEHAVKLQKVHEPISVKYLTRNYSNDNRVQALDKQNPDFFRANLSDLYSTTTEISEPVTVFTEDAVARWFISTLAHARGWHDISKLNFIDTNIDWVKLLKIMSTGGSQFSNMIGIVDSELSREEVEHHIALSTSAFYGRNILILPGNERIEKTMWKFINSLDAHDQFFLDDLMMIHNLNKQFIINNGPFSEKYAGGLEDGAKIKRWFEDNMLFMNKLLVKWSTMPENKDAVSEFFGRLSSTINRIQK